MKKLLFLLPILLFSFDFKKEYFNQNFLKICKYGNAHINKIKNNEDTLSLVGFSCVKSDYFILLPNIINKLKKTKKARENALYFSVLFIDKKLLYSYMMDSIDLSYYRLPLIEHPISIVLSNIINKNFKQSNGIITINYNNKIYQVYKDADKKVFIDVYKNNILEESHWYR